MVPTAFDERIFLKRNPNEAGFDDAPTISKRQFGLKRHHHLPWQQPNESAAAAECHDSDVVQSTLKTSILLALEAVGFDHADRLAIESLSVVVEEYMSHFLVSVQQSMLSCRRVQPIPQDFLYALSAHHLTLRSLLPHLDPPMLPERSQPRLEIEDAQKDADPAQMRIIGKILSDPSSKSPTRYIPWHFPALPSKHTYRAEPVFIPRESDPRKIRERATEEGRLGEEALRRFVGATFEKRAMPTSSSTLKKKSLREEGQGLWKATMEAVTRDASNVHQDFSGMALDLPNASNAPKPIYSGKINADSIYWRKEVTSRPSKSDPQGPFPSVK